MRLLSMAALSAPKSSFGSPWRNRANELAASLTHEHGASLGLEGFCRNFSPDYCTRPPRGPLARWGQRNWRYSHRRGFPLRHYVQSFPSHTRRAGGDTFRRGEGRSLREDIGKATRLTIESCVRADPSDETNHAKLCRTIPPALAVTQRSIPERQSLERGSRSVFVQC